MRWIRAVAHRLPHDSRRLFGVATDVTDVHTADRRLGQATDRLRADVEAMVRFQELTERLTASPSDLDQLLEGVLDATIELHHADGGTVCLYDPETGELDVVVRRPSGPVDEAEPDPDYRVLRPDGAGTQSIPLLDRAGQPLGVLTIHARHPRPRTDLELRLAELYVRQAQAVVAAAWRLPPPPPPPRMDRGQIEEQLGPPVPPPSSPPRSPVTVLSTLTTRPWQTPVSRELMASI